VNKLDVGLNGYSFFHLIAILSQHNLVILISRSLAVYNNKFMLGTACIGLEMIKHNWRMQARRRWRH